MESSNEVFDLVVIGAGITGLGIADRATEVGLKVLLIDKNQVCSGTSANSHHVIHGGFRYLQSFDIPRILNSIRDLDYCTSLSKSLVQSLQCFMPLEASGLKSKLPVSIAMFIYSTIYKALLRKSYGGSIKKQGELSKLAPPEFAALYTYGALHWIDGYVCDLELFAQTLVQKAKSQSCKVAEGQEILEVCKDGKYLIVRSKKGEEYRARKVVNASGPWHRNIRIHNDILLPRQKEELKWCKAFNLVFERKWDLDNTAFGVSSNAGRLFFIVPRLNGFAVGTGHSFDFSSPDNLSLKSNEISEFLADFNQSIIGLELKPSQVIEQEIGILPIKGLENGEPVFYSQGLVFCYNDYLEVIGCKYTNFRSLANKVVRLIRDK